MAQTTDVECGSPARCLDVIYDCFVSSAHIAITKGLHTMFHVSTPERVEGGTASRFRCFLRNTFQWGSPLLWMYSR